MNRRKMEVKSVRGLEDFEQLIHIGNHILIADAGTESGGKAKGPSPHEILSASLASCKAITMSMYAKRKNIPIKTLEVSVDQIKDGETTVFDVKIRLDAEIPEDLKKRLVEIAGLCPVHKLLEGKIQIKTTTI
jgi:putative redox protein